MQKIDLWGAQYSNVPSILLPKHGGGTVASGQQGCGENLTGETGGDR